VAGSLEGHRSAALTSLEARPRAKVNLALAVTGRRQDGYHELASVFLRVGFSDRLSVRYAAPELDQDRLTVEGSHGVPLEGNLVLRAVESLRAECGLPLQPLELTLEKRIPVAAGLAGGSTDAAAALSLAAAMWGVGLSPRRGEALALALGADVPFFTGDHAAALVSGVGEQLEPLPAPRGDAGLLIVTPAIRLSTPDVFRAWDELDQSASRAARSGAVEAASDLAAALRSGIDASQLVTWSDRLAAANDLWLSALAVEPYLARIRSELEERLGQRVLLTGSGSTLVGLYPSAGEAAVAGRRLAADSPDLLSGSSMAACDLIGPDPLWRFP